MAGSIEQECKIAAALNQQALSAIKKFFLLGLSLWLLPCAAEIPAEWITQDTAVLAATCATCHGPQGRAPSRDASIPSLRGQSVQQLVQRLQALQNRGAPDATVMPQLLQGLTSQQLQALAYWFAAPQPEGGCCALVAP